MHVLVTGATGKVGQVLLKRLAEGLPGAGLPRAGVPAVTALCHHRTVEPREGLRVVKGSISDRAAVREALAGVTHVVHLATCKETPEDIMDVAVKGLFWLLEEFRDSPHAQRFLLLGGDAAVGHFFHRHPQPISEDAPYMAYPGCYALSKVLEEVMLQQYGVQYGIDWCCLRAPWIMEKDDFRHSLSFGDDLFGGPDWKAMVPPDVAEKSRQTGAVPLLVEADGTTPVKRNFIHVDDLVEAIALALVSPRARQRLYNISMDEPVDYAAVADHLAKTRGLPATLVRGPYVGNWLDNARARAELGWRPAYDLAKLIDSAWDHVRPPSDPRKVWYPG